MDITLLKQTKISQKMNVTNVYVHYLLHGKRKNIKRLKQMAKVIGISLEELQAQIPITTSHSHHRRARAHNPKRASTILTKGQ